MSEYRVRYKRKGHRAKERRYVQRTRAERFMALLLDPSLERPEDNFEGEGHQYDKWVAGFPPLEFVRIEQRDVTPWTQLVEVVPERVG